MPLLGRGSDAVRPARRQRSTEDDVYDNNEATLQFNVDVETQEMATLVVSMIVILHHFDIIYVGVERKMTWSARSSSPGKPCVVSELVMTA